MKRMQKNLAALVVIAAAVLTVSVAGAADVPKTKADCAAVTEKYEKLAAEQEAVVKEHKDMRQHYRLVTALSLPKQTREKSVADMEKHCDAIVASAQKLADEYKAAAQWHKIHGAEMME